MLQLKDEELIRLAVAGDEEAFVRIYRGHQKGIFRFAFHMTGSNSLAEDITQEVFLTLLKQGAKYDPNRGQFLPFLYGIARNLVMRSARYVPLPLPETDEVQMRDSSTPLHDLAREEVIRKVRSAVLTLPVQYREVIVFCDLQEMSYAEVAGLLDCPVGTVRSRLYRARSLLLSKLTAHNNGGRSYELSAL